MEKKLEIVELNYKSSDKDKGRYIRAHTEIWNNPENHKYLSFTGQPFSDSMLEEWIYGLNKDSQMRYFTAIKTDIVIGIIVLKADVLNGFEICGLGIKPNFKRQGIGNQLVQKAIADAKNSNYRAIQTLVYADNLPMLMLTIKNGFQPYRIDINQRYDGANIVALKKQL
ncbi:GNAT family N-acetyltransferase [Chitinispirillales bacterium ANBcel5]|uniref:GNAT family N-acetyltransferase n=1 Tax=Cellulosispirillum alkaliphilum TaxID=3039283 RepID=UPI002A52D51F|nr:GNAT family N-acetyltransferase [Chitinispirillales bacterium ANBcel5]